MFQALLLLFGAPSLPRPKCPEPENGMNRLRWTVLALAPCLMLVSGCSEAVTFNNTLSNLTRELEAAGRKFGEAIVRHEGHHEPLQDAYADMVGEVGRIVKRGRAVTVPKTKAAQEYYDAFLEFLDLEEHICDHECAALVRRAAAGDRAGFLEVIERLKKREDAGLAKLKAAQKAYAAANGVSVVE
jgi:hypothetical protein